MIVALFLLAGGYKAKLERVERQLRAVRAELKSLKKKEERLLDQLELLEREEDLLAQSMELLEAQGKALEAEAQRLEKEIARASQSEEETRRKLSKALEVLRRAPRPGFVEALLDAGSVFRAWRRVLFLKRLVIYELSLIKSLRRQRERLKRLKEAHRRALRELAEAKAKLAEKAQELKEAKAEKRRLLKRVRRQKSRKERYLKKLLASRRKLKAIIRSRSKGKRVKKPIKLLKPCEGRIVAGFGVLVDERYGTKIKNNGIDIRVPRGSPVRAAAKGKVVYIGWLTGYGNVVIVEHDGFHTVYSRLREVLVKEGQRVLAGTVLGKAGGEPVHFELRVGGEAVDPEPYLY